MVLYKDVIDIITLSMSNIWTIFSCLYSVRNYPANQLCATLVNTLDILELCEKL